MSVPLGNPNALGAPGSTLTFSCAGDRPAIGGNKAHEQPYVIDVQGDGRSAHYGNASMNGPKAVATLCIQSGCITDNDAPSMLVADKFTLSGFPVSPTESFVSFRQMVDLGGTGKPYAIRWSQPYFITYYTEPDGSRIKIDRWFNRQPVMYVTRFGMPGPVPPAEIVQNYAYAIYSPCASAACSPYAFDLPMQGSALSADFNGSGYSGMVFGFFDVAKGSGGVWKYNRAESTVCLSTGRQLDCGIRLKYSNAQYMAPRAVGNFVGDGQPTILMEEIRQQDGMPPTPIGKLHACRLKGNDTSGGSSTTDQNMECTPWSATAFPIYVDASQAADQVYVMDLLGTGRPQLVYYHSGKLDGAGNWTEDGRWELFEPVDVAVAGEALDRLVSVVNGLGAMSAVGYADGLRGAVTMSGASNLAYPQHANNVAGKIVTRLSLDTGSGRARTYSYRYEDAGIDLQGRGGLGFAKVIRTDDITGATTSTRYSQQWPFTGMATGQTTVIRGVTIADVTHALKNQTFTHGNGATTVFPYIESTQAVRLDLDGSELGTERTIYTYGDNWGNLTQQQKLSSGAGLGFTETITTSFRNDASRWLLGLPLSIATNRTDSVTGGLTRSVTRDYDATTGLMMSEAIEPGNAMYELWTTFDRSGNVFGLVGKTTQRWRDPSSGNSVSRTLSDITYDNNGRFPLRVRNALGHEVAYGYDAGTGARSSLTDANGLPTIWQVNGFGRVIAETRPDGSMSRSYSLRCDSQCPPGAALVQVMDHLYGASRMRVPQMKYLDSVGHVLREQTWGQGGEAIVIDSRYDQLGRLVESDQPRFVAKLAYLQAHHDYDDLHRVIRTIVLDDAGARQESRTTYRGLRTDLVNPKGQQRNEVRDVLGQLRQVVDAKGGNTFFEYEPFGNLSKTTDPNTNVVKVKYDLLGRKILLDDRNTGQIEYGVDPLGRTWYSKSPMQAKSGQKTSFEFDVLDRMTGRYESDLESHWLYDSASNGIGLLAEAYTLRMSKEKDYQRLYTYDDKSRPRQVTLVLDAVYRQTTEYDAWGRTSKSSYKRGNDADKVFDLRYGRTGYMERVERAGLPLWQLLNSDAALRETRSVLGNGLTQLSEYSIYTGRVGSKSLQTASQALRLSEAYHYDVLGNVTHRSQYWDGAGFDEDFGYDVLNRLETSTVRGQTGQFFRYDAGGNLLSKSNVAGSYEYPAQGANSVRPNAVTRIGGVGDFTYDDNGNLRSGAGRTITWTSFDMPAQISRGTPGNCRSPGVAESCFIYGPEHQRTRQDRSDGLAIIYAGAQEVEVKNNQASVKTYWPNGLGVEIDRSGSATELNYFHKDRLGSVISITDQSGTSKEKLAYDAWGKRRELAGSATPDTLDGKTDNRGFTGHEMLDQLDLVHMNGRIYDPLVARFISADPLISDPGNGQFYNRYSYVQNNPTNLTDPTGFESARDAGESTKKLTDSLKSAVAAGSDEETGSGNTGREKAVSKVTEMAGNAKNPGEKANGSKISAMSANNLGWNQDTKKAGGCTMEPCIVISSKKEEKLRMLPQKPEEAGFFTYGTPINGGGSYANPRALSLIFKVERQWALNENRRFGVGNISLRAGGPFDPHGTHRVGAEIDIRPIRKDGLEGVGDGLTWKSDSYDQEATQRLVNALRSTGMVETILFNDPKIDGVKPWVNHDNHLHVKVKSNE
ncbi:hypothetical protein MJ904_19335 [Massilia sp. MB5]|uniref:RHS repeat domain-containing protein n=1 Tax=Massilia sp. MB5 TaxID=2919578 RepID=UPI001F1181A6|nr:RHS repeat-associated core domain-containing protein [Massilia sp. MB5]UMR29225.1 hypothetical protein MJ904_19335 [Massilia sp. MB5]